MDFLSENKFYPRVLFYDITTRSYISQFLLGHLVLTPDETHDVILVAKIAEQLAKVHRLDFCGAHHRYSPQQVTEKVILYLKRFDKFPAQFVNRLAILCHRINELLRKSDANDEVFSHGDMTPYNIMYNKDHNDVVFADWELSGYNNRFWDLAKFSVECGFDDTEDVAFLSSYYGFSPKEAVLLKFYITKLQVQYFLAVWAMLKVYVGCNDASKLKIFKHFYHTRIHNCKKIISSERYKRGIDYLNRLEGPLVFPDHVYHYDRDLQDNQAHHKGPCVMTLFKPSANIQQTLVILKPDLMLRNHSEEAIKFFEQHGFTVIAKKSFVMTEEQVESLYPKINTEAHQGIYYDVLDLMTLGPVMALVLQSVSAVQRASELKGATNPLHAATGTFRNTFGINEKYNAMHCSDTLKDAEREIKLLFGDLEKSFELKFGT